MDADAIRDMIEAGLPGARAFVRGDDGTHFEAVVVSEDFAGKGLVEQHRLVYGTLGDKMRAEIHALSIRTFTPAEWEAAGCPRP